MRLNPVSHPNITSRLGGYYNDEDVGREGRYTTRGFLTGYPGSYDRFAHDDDKYSIVTITMTMQVLKLRKRRRLVPL